MMKVSIPTSLILIGVFVQSAAAQTVDLYDPLIEANLLAVEIEAQLTPNATLATQIQDDLAAIRLAYPVLADIRARPDWLPGEAFVSLHPSAFQQYEQGTFTGFDSLFATLGVPNIQEFKFISALLLEFGQVYHSERLAELFEVVDGVQYAEPNYTIGDGDDIVAELDRTYTLSRGWGDCPAGCIYRQSWDFTVTDEGVRMIPEPAPGDFDLDGEFSGNDFLIWQRNPIVGNLSDWENSYGITSPSVAASHAVPEPSAVALVAISLLFIQSKRR